MIGIDSGRTNRHIWIGVWSGPKNVSESWSRISVSMCGEQPKRTRFSNINCVWKQNVRNCNTITGLFGRTIGAEERNPPFRASTKICWCIAKGHRFPFNADDVRVPYKMNVRNTAINNPLGKIPTDVWEKNNHTTSKEYVQWHPTQKPLSLLERIIKANSNEGDIVMDIFSGSGSTAIACNNTKREFIGCEKSTEYWKRSHTRIQDYKKCY